MSRIKKTTPSPDDIIEKEDVFLDNTLRPGTFDEYIGQNHIKQNLKILLEAAAL